MNPAATDAGPGFQILGEVERLAGSPAYLYDEAAIRERCAEILRFPAPFGLTVRFAMKACPNAAILRLIRDCGLGIDASSVFEVERAVRAGFEPAAISLSSQELGDDFRPWFERGLEVNACSPGQVERIGRAFPGAAIGLRFNPGIGSGGTGKTNVGGPAASFGIWHEKVPEVREIVRRHGLVIRRIHTHIGSGSDPAVWGRVAALSLGMAREFPEAEILNLGGGYKVARVAGETPTDPVAIGAPVAEALRAFAAETGRELKLELEPGTFLVANAGWIVCRVQDVVDTGPTGYRFAKLNAGMTEILRPSLYAAQHPIRFIPADGADRTRPSKPIVVVGHCCESGDLLTPEPGDAEALAPRDLPEPEPGDYCLIGGAGAYCAAMSAKNYNSFPEAGECLLRPDGSVILVRQRQTLDQMLANERQLP